MTLPEGYKSWFQLYRESVTKPLTNGYYQNNHPQYIAEQALIEISRLIPADEVSLNLMLDECYKEQCAATHSFLTTLKKIV